ncbi:zinc finger transcriptional activator, partial [Ophidiomyces ophidiicola]
PPHADDPGYATARRAWSRLRFVRAGWFGVDEAMAYIAYYYDHLAPLTPIVLPDFRRPAAHPSLLAEEPVLTVTMLTIASRHMKLAGNGATSRAYSIHEKLWSYLKGMIERLIWGQEKFGAPAAQPRPFPPAAAAAAAAAAATPPSKRSGNLRALGTVEALLLLTDWHPRALHFPPGDDENTLLDMDPHALAPDTAHHKDQDQDQDQNQNGPPEGRLAFYQWLEPVWRSDRMSWMLLSTAQALAFELGVFDPKTDARPPADQLPSCEPVRKRRLRRLILVYVSQSSGRLGIPSMLPLPQWSQAAPADHDHGHDLDLTVDRVLDCWLDISKIMYNSNQVLFPSKEYTTNLIKTGQYRDRIAEFAPSLADFRRKFDRIPMSPHMRHILTIEYEYTRLYVNCLALQAVVDRWTTMSHESTQNHANGAGSTSSGTVPLRVLLDQYEVNEPYIQEVVDASRKILQTVLDGLVPGDRLKHAPVRTFFRVLSGMIFILKTFTLGAKEDDVRVSLELQDRTIESLRTCIVDDVHLSVTIADLLQLLTANIRTRFLRFAPFDRLDCASRERTPPPLPSSDDAHPDFRWPPPPPPPPPLHALAPNNSTTAAAGFPFDANSAPSTTNDPLASIPARPIDSTNLHVSFMPPPPSVFYNYYDHSSTSPKLEQQSLDDAAASSSSTTTVAPHALSATAGPAASTSMSDWFALPLDQFFNSATAGVDQGLGGTGPMVGEFDMLEVLLKDQYTDAGAGTGATSGGGGGGGGTSASGGSTAVTAGGASGDNGGTNGAGLSSQFL